MAANIANQRNYVMETSTNNSNNNTSRNNGTGNISNNNNNIINNNNNNNNNHNTNGTCDETAQRKEKIIIQNQMFINMQQQQPAAQQQQQQQHQQIADVQQQHQQQPQVVKRAPKKLSQPPAIFSTSTAALTLATASAVNDSRDMTANTNTTHCNSNNNIGNNQDIAHFIANSPTAASYVQAQLSSLNGLNIQSAPDQHQQQHQLTASVVTPTSVAATTLPIVTYNGNQYCVITHTGDLSASAGVIEKQELLQLTTDKEGKTNFILMQPATAVTAAPNAVGMQHATGNLVSN